MEKSHEQQLEDYKRFREAVPELPWRAWGSWYSWGSAMGLSIFIISVGVFILLLHLSGIF